jgi:TatD DNase family protein
MIDTHCHLEQPDYDKDRRLVIERCRQQLQAVITSCVNPTHFDLTVQLVSQNKRFVFATVSVHPRYVKKFSDEEIRRYVERIKSAKDSIVAIGETGLDYNWVKEVGRQEKQKQLFLRLIELSREMRLPLVIHSRDATEDAINILEQNIEKHVQLHMFTDHSLLKRVLDKGWLISVNTLLLRSKNVRKIVRDCPLEQLMLETDSPWLGIGKYGGIKPKDEVRNEPTSVRLVAERIGEIKKIDTEQVDRQTTNNAIRFFNLQNL